MREGFTVQPEKLTELRDETAKIAARNHILVEQLTRARESGTGDLLGSPGDLGGSGPPVEFSASSDAMLSNLQTMIGSLHRLHVAVETHFTRMMTALEDTRDLYQQVDDERAKVFDGILIDRAPDGG